MTEMSSMRFNASFSFSLMNCIYPLTKKPSKKRKPIKRNKWTRSPLFFLRSSPLSLRLGRYCHHCGRETLHLSESCVLHLRINCVQLLCMVFVFSVKLICGFLYHSCNFVYFFSYLCLYLDHVSLICIFHVGLYNRLIYVYKLFLEMPQWV